MRDRYIPVDRRVAVLEAVLTDTPRAETTALILADAVLARALGCPYRGSTTSSRRGDRGEVRVGKVHLGHGGLVTRDLQGQYTAGCVSLPPENHIKV